MAYDPEKAAAMYGPIGKEGWGVIEAEIDRQCAEAGLSPLEKYHCAFTLNLTTGEIKLVPPAK